MSQTDFKRLVAYSSVSHMGFVTLGAAVMTPAGVNGALFMMVAHGITSAMMFFVVGVVYDRAHHRELSRLGGLATTMPVYTGFSDRRLLRQPRPAGPVRVRRRGDGPSRQLPGRPRRLGPDHRRATPAAARSTPWPSSPASAWS